MLTARAETVAIAQKSVSKIAVVITDMPGHDGSLCA